MDIKSLAKMMAPLTDNHGEAIEVLQKELIEHYVKIEGLPEPPISLHTKPNQILLKDFIARVTEELGEAYESYEELLGANTNENRLQALWNANEELADTLHFLWELKIYSGISLLNVLEVTNSFEPTEMEKKADVDWLSFMFLLMESNVDKRFNTFSVLELDKCPIYLMGGNSISPRMLEQIAIMMWGVTYQLQLMRNCLKNKPWKQTMMMSDETKVKYHFSMAFLNLIKLFKFLGLSVEGIYQLYWMKNQVNQFRIRSKY
jgi:hypothetical protein